jgi:glyoxylase-like metal-dependent hydrolase (beta-lactamase superfamily II)
MGRIELPGYDAIGVLADNPGPFTLSGTNTWIYGREPAWLIDPGPALRAHLDEISEELDARGGLGCICLTHDHADHSEAVGELMMRFSPVPLAAARGDVSALLDDGDRCGPFDVLATPGHAPDHLTYITDDGIAFTGDAVLGIGSVFVAEQLGEYLEGLERLLERGPKLIAPGHGPIVTDPAAKLSEYIEHRLAREAALIDAIAQGNRSTEELLDAVWADAPAPLRGAAALTLDAHLEKLDQEGRLPYDVERGAWSEPVPTDESD